MNIVDMNNFLDLQIKTQDVQAQKILGDDPFEDFSEIFESLENFDEIAYESYNENYFTQILNSESLEDKMNSSGRNEKNKINKLTDTLCIQKINEQNINKIKNVTNIQEIKENPEKADIKIESTKVIVKSCLDQPLLSDNLLKSLKMPFEGLIGESSIKETKIECKVESPIRNAYTLNTTLYKPIEINFIHEKHGDITIILSVSQKKCANTLISIPNSFEFKQNLNKDKYKIKQILEENDLNANEIYII